jgi:copper chaperone CopZ
VQGVRQITIHHKAKEARVTYDDAKAAPAELAKAVRDAGFACRVKP